MYARQAGVNFGKFAPHHIMAEIFHWGITCRGGVIFSLLWIGPEITQVVGAFNFNTSKVLISKPTTTVYSTILFRFVQIMQQFSCLRASAIFHNSAGWVPLSYYAPVGTFLARS